MELTFKPTQKQFLAWELLTDQDTTEIGYGGGAGGGKSFVGCFWLLAMCIAYPGTRWLVGRKELVNLKRTTLNTLWKVCAEYKIRPGDHYSFNQQTNIIKFFNGSEILLFDLSTSPSDPEYTRLGSLELTGAFVDESNEVEEKAITILKTRLGRQFNDKYGLKPKLLETFNPNKGHVYLRFYKPWKSNSLPHYRKFIQSLATDNPYLTQEYIEQLQRGDRVTVERLLLGNFEYDDDPYVLMGYDAITDIFTNTVDVSEQKFMTVDAARLGGDLIVIKCWRGLLAYRVKYFSRVGLNITIEHIRTIAAEEQIPWSRILVDEDGVGGGIVDMMQGIKGFMGNAAPLPRTKDGKPENYKNLRAQCYFELAEAVNNHRIAVRMEDPTMKERMTLELQQVKRINVDKDQKNQIISKDEMKKALGHSPDFADTLMMRMYFEIKPLGQRERLNEKPKSAIEKEFDEFKKGKVQSLAKKL